MKYSWTKIKDTISKEVKSIFSNQEQPSYPFTFEEGIDLFCKTIFYKTGERDLDGIDAKIIPTLDKYFHGSKDKNDSLNYLTQIATKLDTYLQKLLFITDNDKYLRLKSQNKGMYHYVKACGINKNNIDFRTPITQIQTTLLSSNFGRQIYFAYNQRNVEAHSAVEYSDAEISQYFQHSLIIYLFATFEKYTELETVVSNVNIPDEIKISEITKELTPPREYAILSEDLIGRNSEIASLQEKASNTEKIILLTGIGGIGKSSLLKGYIKSFKSSFNHIIWISYNENLVSSFNGCIPLIENLYIDIPEEISEFDKYCFILNYISKLSGNNLLILDNYFEDSTQNLSKLPLGSNWMIMTTSRMELKSSKYYCIPTTPLNFNSAKLLFAKHYTGEIEDELLKELFDLIEYHTLSIELLAKTLETNFTINGVSELLSHLKTSSISNEDWQVKLESNYSEHELNLRNHLLHAFRLSTLDDSEKQFLLYFSILPVELFSGSELIKIFQINEDNISQFIDSLNSLNKKGWLKKIDGNFISHAIIQEITKVTVVPNENNCSHVISGLNALLKLDDNVPVSCKQKYLSSALSVLKTIKSDSEDIYLLNHLTSVTFKELGSYDKALHFAEKAIEIAEKLSFEYLQWPIYSHIAIVYRKKGKLEEAFKFYYKATDIIENSDEKDITMISVFTNLGTLHEQIGNRDNLYEAKSLYEFAISELEQYKDEIETNQNIEVQLAYTKGSLGKVYNLLGLYEQAIELQLYAYNVLSQVLNKDNLPASINANNLGLSYGNNKDLENSFKYHQIAVDIQTRILPEEHPELSVSLSGLANAYRNRGNNSKAIEIFERILQIGERTLDCLHPTLARRKANLAAVLNMPQNINRARKLYKEAIEIETKHYGANNPNVALSIYNLGILNLEENNEKNALENFQKALRILVYNYGANHEMSKMAMWRIQSIVNKSA